MCVCWYIYIPNHSCSCLCEYSRSTSIWIDKEFKTSTSWGMWIVFKVDCIKMNRYLHNFHQCTNVLLYIFECSGKVIQRGNMCCGAYMHTLSVCMYVYGFACRQNPTRSLPVNHSLFMWKPGRVTTCLRDTTARTPVAVKRMECCQFSLRNTLCPGPVVQLNFTIFSTCNN